MDEASLVAALREAESPFLPEVEALVEAWPEVPAHASGPALWFLGLRVESSLNFVCQLCHCGDHPESSFVPFPADCSADDAARFFLTTWWESHGRRNAACDLICEWHDENVHGE